MKDKILLSDKLISLTTLGLRVWSTKHPGLLGRCFRGKKISGLSQKE